MNITIIGTGYVGLVTGACFSEMGNKVFCIDIDEEKINKLNRSVIPIHEPGLENLVINNRNAKRLFFYSQLKNSLKKSKICFIAVGTPEGNNGQPNMEYIYSAAKEIGENIENELIIVNKSTVPIGTAKEVKSIIAKEIKKRNLNIKFHMVSNPEFLKEGDAIQDFMRPDRVVIGSESDYAKHTMKQLYAPFTMNHDRIIMMGINEAELTKYAANAMLATKISFINEISNICDKLKIDIESIRKGIGSDKRIGYSFIYPGAGYGGSCFPKDIKALIHTAKKSGTNPMILNAVEKRNQHQKKQIFKYITDKFGTDLKDKIFTIWGLAFKPGTDDMREAPSIDVINSITNSGGKVQAFDPVSNNEALKIFSKTLIRDNIIVFYKDNYDALENSDGLIIMTEWRMFRNVSIGIVKQKMKNLCIFDGRNQYDPNLMKREGFYYKGIGR